MLNMGPLTKDQREAVDRVETCRNLATYNPAPWQSFTLYICGWRTIGGFKVSTWIQMAMSGTRVRNSSKAPSWNLGL